MPLELVNKRLPLGRLAHELTRLITRVLELLPELRDFRGKGVPLVVRAAQLLME